MSQEGAATDYGTGYEAAPTLLTDDAIDGVFCVTDPLALGFLDAARSERGRCVPDDLSVIRESSGKACGALDCPQALSTRGYGVTMSS